MYAVIRLGMIAKCKHEFLIVLNKDSVPFMKCILCLNLRRIEVKEWLRKLGVVDRKPPGNNALDIDYSKLQLLPSFRNRPRELPQHTRPPVSRSPIPCLR